MTQHALMAESMALTSLDVGAILNDLPARTKAGVVWVRPVFDKLVQRLQTEELTDDLLAEVTPEAVKPLASLGGAFWTTFAGTPEAWQATISSAIHRDVGLLDQLLDEDRRESLLWIKGLLTSFFDLVLRHTLIADQAALDKAVTTATPPPAIRHWVTSQVALMAAVDLAKRNEKTERVGDLIDVAFLELLAFKDAAAKDGVWLTPFPGETKEARANRVLRYAELARGVLTEEDVAAFEEARLRELR